MGQNFTPEQTAHLNDLLSFANNKNKHVHEKMALMVRGEMPCAKKLIRALDAVKMMMEAGALAPTGHACNAFYEVMSVVDKDPCIRKLAKDCGGCVLDPDKDPDSD